MHPAHLSSSSAELTPTLSRFAESTLPTRYGHFRVIVYQESAAGQEPKEHLAILKGAVEGAERLPLRVHSECFTGEVLGSLKCDCREQLELALETISREPRGAVIYLRQEGRGIGLGNKIRAYALQEGGADTIQANHLLGFETDLRRYDLAAHIIRDLGITSVGLLTNNPDKVSGLEAAGITVERLPIVVPANRHSRDYLAVKRDKLGHMIPPTLRSVAGK
jgi:GTP cyclohydrolase II